MTQFTPPADAGIQHARVTTGSVPLSSEADVTVTWPEAFADTNYTVVAQVIEDSGGESMRVRRIRSQTPTGCVVNVVNNDALSSNTGTVHAIAISD